MTTAMTTPETAAAGARTVDTFLEAVSAGAGVPVGLFAPDAVLDASVPGWRFAVRGGDAVARQYSGSPTPLPSRSSSASPSTGARS